MMNVVLGGRNETAYGAGTGQRAHGQSVVIPVLAHFRQGNGRHGYAAGKHVAHHRAEQGAGHHAAHGKPAAHVSHPLAGTVVDVLAEPGVEAQVSHEHEEHERRPGIAPRRAVKRLARRSERRRNALELSNEDESRGDKGKGHRNAEEKENEEQHETGHADLDGRHARHTVRGDVPHGEHARHGRHKGQQGLSRAVQTHGGSHALKKLRKQGHGQQTKPKLAK